MQWSPPCHLILQTNQTTCRVRPLTSPAGRGGKFPQDITRNTSSIKIAALRPADFWIGARVLRQHKKSWFLGTVVDVQDDAGKMLYQVDYDDCGKEDIDVGALYDSVVYHPRLENKLYEDTQLPAVGQAVMFAQQLQPRFGVIAEINPTLTKPIAVMLWKPHSKSKSLLKARFKSTLHLDTGEEITRIAPAQIKTHVSFNDEGFISKKSQDRVRSILTRSQRQPHSKPKPRARSQANQRSKNDKDTQQDAASSPVPPTVNQSRSAKTLNRRRTVTHRKTAVNATVTTPVPIPTHRYPTRGKATRHPPT